MLTQYEKLKNILREMFQMDQADLDFGIYRIMNAKREEIEKFLDAELLPQVKEEFSKYRGSEIEEKKKALLSLEKTISDSGMNPDESPKVKALRDEIAKYGDDDALANEVFSHLSTFFRRYYDTGDFLSLRRYKKDTYAIPYEGEEVKLHWANADQYYIKTSEYLRDYAFKLSDGKKVHFKLVDAYQDKDNNKTESGKERKFKLHEEEPIQIQGKEAFIQFVYLPEKEKQDNLNKKAIELLAGESNKKLKEFLELFAPAPTHKNTKRTVIEKHLYDYTARFNFDFFIHKDLGGFLSRELDFYIKNEVLFVDDLDAQDEKKLKSAVAKVKVIKHIARKIIVFLATLEDFQRKLFLKKKFVVDSGYCVTLDLVPETLYQEITKNDAQREEWENLFAINEIKKDLTRPGYTKPLSIEFLKANRYLMLDTKHFDEKFKDKILASFDNFDKICEGVIINSENFQALNLLQEKYNQKIKLIYIDPPYNTDSTPIIYKNDYKSSSWASLMNDRINLAMSLITQNGVKAIAIDDTELSNLSKLLEQYTPAYRFSKVTVVHNPKGSITKDFNRVHEYTLFLTHEEDKKAINRTAEENKKPRKMRRWGENSLRVERKPSFYPIYIKDGKIIRIGEVPADDFHPSGKNAKMPNGEIEIWPIDQDGVERRWNFGLDSIEENIPRITIQEVDGEYDLFLTHEITVPKSVWTGGEYDAGNYGNTLLIDILGKKLFDFPKSINLVKRCVSISSTPSTDTVILDYFGGSGTTAHAVIDLNRECSGKATSDKRKYIIVEMGEYFNTVLKPRIQKVVYSKIWKEGKPQELKSYINALKKNVSDAKKQIRELQGLNSQEEFEFETQRLEGEVIRNESLIQLCEKELKQDNAFGGVSHCLKYLRLESYDDTLDNLIVGLPAGQQKTLEKIGKQAREEYMLSYMLDVETKASDSLLNLDRFSDPFSYTLKIRKDNELKARKVDLVETFNYLIGLYVEQMETIRGFKVIRGKLRTGEKTLVIWRNTKENANDDLDEFFKKQKYNTLDFEFDLIFVNGDNNLENLKVAEDKWKVRMIEEEFKKRMFETVGA